MCAGSLLLIIYETTARDRRNLASIGLIPAWKFPLNLVAASKQGMLAGNDATFWSLQILSEATFLFLAAIGIGLILVQRWAIRASRLAALIAMAVARGLFRSKDLNTA